MTRPFKRFVMTAAQRLGYEIRKADQVAESASDQLFVPWLEVLRRTGPIATVFDVGAAGGQTVKLFRSHMPDAVIHAFEPFPETFEQLQRVAQADGRTRPHNVALGDRNHSATFHRNLMGDTNSLLPNAEGSGRFAPADWMKPVGATTVQVERLDEVFQRESLERIDVLKLDVQGYERQVLEGAGDLLHPQTIRGLMIELLFVPYYEGQAWGGEILELLRERGYRLYGVSEVYHNREHGWHWADGLFIADGPERAT